MTIYSKRRGRRPLAAVVAAMLVASVLAVVAGSPAQAANTAYEVRVDTNGDLAPDAREFAGIDRYDTALKLAHNFAGRSKYSAVPTVFVASGESLVDSISVSGLAGSLSAPVLLTRGGSLHGGVKDYIEDHGTSLVYVLGGPAAISDAVLTEIEDLRHGPDVERLAGDDRYQTAAAIAGAIQSNSSWCGTTAASAVLINGSSDALPFGVAVGTMAYALGVPVLMTAADELPDATTDYIRDNNVENVQVIGGTDTVSKAVADSLSTLGVDTVQRVDGETASAVSVALAKAAAACQGVAGASLTVSSDRVVLVRGNPDGVAAAPVLASGISGDSSTGLVPPLVVDDSLPAAVRDYLAATRPVVGGSKLNLGIIAVGGPRAVSPSVMDAALSAAAATGELTVQIGATADTTGDGVASGTDPVRPKSSAGQFTLYFSDAVTFDDETPGTDAAKNPVLKGKLRDMITVNGIPAVIDSAVQGGDNCDSTKVDVTLGQPLRSGDQIAVTKSGHKLGTSLDLREVAPASSTVQAKPADRTPPSVSILGIAGTGSFYVTVTDAGGLENRSANTLDASHFTFTPNAAATAGATITAVSNTAVATTTPPTTRMTAVVSINRTAVPNVVAANELMVGDTLKIKADVTKDLRTPRPNANLEASSSVIAAQASPRITSVILSDPNHSAQTTWIVPVALVGGSTGAGQVEIMAKKGGDADGAAGNGWRFVFDRASTYSPAKPLDIAVGVDPVGKRVTVRFNNGPLTATMGDLLAALKGSAEFTEMFTAGFTTCSSAAAGSRTPLGLIRTAAARNQTVTGDGAGRTKVAIEVHFNAYVDTVDHDGLLEDVLDYALSRSANTTLATLRAVPSSASGGSGGLDLAAPTAINSSSAPTMVVRYEATTALVGNLPQPGDRVVTLAGHQGAVTEIAGPPRYPAIRQVTAVATGYADDKQQTPAPGSTGAPASAADDARDKVDEDKNAASTVLISGPSSRVRRPS